MTYWDASAFAPLIRQEATSLALRSLHGARSRHLTLATTRVEAECMFARLLREGKIDGPQAGLLRTGSKVALDGFSLVFPHASVIDAAVRLARAHPIELRAGDALHLAAWQVVSGGDPQAVEFVCLDRRLRDAALSEGATVLP